MLQAEGVDFSSVNVLDYPDIREGGKFITVTSFDIDLFRQDFFVSIQYHFVISTKFGQSKSFRNGPRYLNCMSTGSLLEAVTLSPKCAKAEN